MSERPFTDLGVKRANDQLRDARQRRGHGERSCAYVMRDFKSEAAQHPSSISRTVSPTGVHGKEGESRRWASPTGTQ